MTRRRLDGAVSAIAIVLAVGAQAHAQQSPPGPQLPTAYPPGVPRPPAGAPSAPAAPPATGAGAQGQPPPANSQPGYGYGTQGYAGQGYGYGQPPYPAPNGYGYAAPHAAYTPYPQPYAPAPAQRHDTPATPTEPKEQEPGPVQFDLAAGTVFPLGLGPEATLEIPGRVLFQLDLAWMPGAYGKAISGFIGAIGEDDAVIRPVVEDALSNSFVVRGSVGWRPFPSHGFELYLGYTGITVRGDVPAAAVADIIGGDLEDELEATVAGDVGVSSQLHNIHVAVGWRFLALQDHMVIRASLGYTQTLGSKSSVDIPDHDDLDARIDPVLDEELDAIVKSDVKLPLIALNIGYRF